MDLETCKKNAAEKAASFIEDGMVIGLGTGSTAAYFIKALIAQQKKDLKVIASSSSSYILAKQGGLPIHEPVDLTSIDLYIDGADEIDPQKQMIKGAGGALLREKILARMSNEMVVIVDETKLVAKLGARPLPVEIMTFGLASIVHHLEQLGYRGKLRLTKNGSLFLTDNNNALYDIQLSSTDCAEDHARISSVPGVVETGFFQERVGRVVIGFKDGSVIVQ